MTRAKASSADDEPEGAKGPEIGTRLTALEIHENIVAPAEQEMRRPAAALFWSALASGLVIGFSFLASAFTSSVVTAPYRRAAAAAAYPLGFIFVIISRSELFTENTLQPVMPLLERRDRETLYALLRLWALLLVGNLVGAAIFGTTLARTPVVAPDLDPALLRIAREAVSGDFGHLLYHAVFAGWLIALLGWLLAATRSTGAQVVLVWLCTAPISALGFRHSIAGSVEGFYLSAAGGMPLGSMLLGFVLPAVIGNAIGGVLFVALLSYAQVAPDKEQKERGGGTPG
ncbi:MAG: formate/nitrite transporter family protein [Gemmatimonadales bacterium]